MRKPPHDRQTTERRIEQVQASIEHLKQGVEKEQERKIEFKMYIKLHEQYEANPEGFPKKPMYDHSSLVGGVQHIDQKITRIQELIQKEEQKLLNFKDILRQVAEYEAWAARNPEAASGVIEIAVPEEG
jgi:hypothetical protein